MKSASNKLGRKELLSLAVGQVIGAGVITVLGAAIAETGKSVWLAYALAVVLGYMLIFPYILLSSVFKLEGGFYSIVKKMAGEKWGGLFILLFFPKALILSLFGLSMGYYVNSIAPMLDPKFIAIAIITFFYILNMFEVTFMAKAQKIMSLLLIITLVLMSVTGVFKVDPATLNFSSGDFFLNSKEGFISSIMLLIYSTTGYYYTVNYGAVAKNPTKDIPWAMNVTAIILFFLYTIIAIVASGVLPISEVANKPLTYVVEAIFSKKIAVIFVLGGPVMALTSSLNSTLAAQGRLFHRAAIDGWFPKIFRKMNKNNQPIVVITAIYILGLLPILFNFSIKLITNNTVLVSYVANLIPIASILLLPTKYKEEWKKSKFYMKDKVFYLCMTLTLSLQIWVIYNSAKALSKNILLITLGYFVMALLTTHFRSKSKEKSEQEEISPTV